ncbi:MAG: protein kinase [Myxococcota bacterium]
MPPVLAENLPAIAGALALLVLVALLVRVRGGGGRRGPLPGVERLLRDGQYAEAGELAAKHERYEEALDYFVRAQQPAKAAQVAAKMGQVLRAAELFEKAGNKARAAQLYLQAGYEDKAKLLAPPPERAKSRAPSGRASQDPDATRSARGDQPALSEAERAERQARGREEAHNLLQAGDVRGAAQAFRDAELYDEAVHLYVNVLGAPGEAAALVAERGNHERAAELYELAGEKERAASAWIEIARQQKAPEKYAKKIVKLSPEAGVRYLEEETKSIPVSQDSVELHYLLATTLVKLGEKERAAQVFERVQSGVGNYRDIHVWINQLQVTQVNAGPGQRIQSVSGPGSDQLKNALRPEDLARIAEEAASAADEAIRQSALLDPSIGEDFVPETAQLPIGLDAAPLPDLLCDSAVRAARVGQSPANLMGFLGGRECDLQNIEVYYRLGLAYLGWGKWAEALSTFHKVEEVAPGYRDAWKRIEVIEGWQSAIQPHLTALGVAGTKIQKRPKESRFVLNGELGRGGMAVVYRATDQVLGRDVALKFIAEERLGSRDIVELFKREARAVAQLNHPSIVTIYDFGTLEGRFYIAMEYVEGITVRSYVKQHQKLPVVEALRITTQLLDALDAAHRRQIIHRDIKPSNVMRTESGLVKLMDFGLAKSLDSGGNSSVIAGTPAYMAPEQILGEKLDGRTDLFAVGVSLFEMLSGKLPFEKLDRSRPPKSLRQLADSVPPMLEEVVLRALAPEPTARFRSATEFAAPLREILSAADRATSSLRG